MGGMLFSLGIFAVKVGFGFGFGGVRWKGIFLTLSLYLLLFILTAMFSEHLSKMLEPVLRKGPHLHALMAIGMIAWGISLIRKKKTNVTENMGHIHSKISDSSLIMHHSLLLLIPCPVCLTAMIFSTWSALGVIQLPAVLVGYGLGMAFILLSLAVYFFLKLVPFRSSLMTQEISLGLIMIAIGLYFIASLVLPAKIEEAKGIYRSSLLESGPVDIHHVIGVFALLFAAMVIGYFVSGIIMLVSRAVHNKPPESVASKNALPFTGRD